MTMTRKKERNTLEPGSPVSSAFLLKEKRLAVSKAGKKYMTLILSDKNGDYEGKLWDEADMVDAEIERMTPVRVEGVVSVYREKMQITVRTIQPLDWDDDLLEQLLPVSRFSIEELEGALDEVLGSIRNRYLQKLVKVLRDDRALMSRFFGVPAAKMIHHAYVRGLAEHTVSMLEIAAFLAGHYEKHFPEKVDRDVLLVGVFLHDLGKTEEYEYERGLDFTTEGRLLGHLLLGAEILGKAADRIPGFPEDLETRLKHLVMSHHGEFDKGAPVLPVTIEAQLLHLVDYLDSQVNAVMTLLTGADLYGWTQYSNKFCRRFYNLPVFADLLETRTVEDLPPETPPSPGEEETSPEVLLEEPPEDFFADAPEPVEPSNWVPTDTRVAEPTAVLDGSAEDDRDEELPQETVSFQSESEGLSEGPGEEGEGPGGHEDATSEYEVEDEEGSPAKARKKPPRGPSLF